MVDEGTVEFAGLALDAFQIEAIKHLDEGYSVVVSAPTGVGKTLVADYLISKIVERKERVVYTAPIKALSNQKYKEFKRLFGHEAVGIMTGDVVINPEAPVLIMTTEIFRNMLLIDPRRVYGTSYVILDEIHFIADEERGSVWEESLIFMPKEMRFLGLSATIPNVDELAEWISSIRSDEVKVVTHFDRIVPLTHQLFEKGMGMGTFADLRKYRERVLKAAEKREQETGQYQDARTLFPETTHVDLIEGIRHAYLPCLYFVFSRRQCELKAAELAEKYNFLTPEETCEVESVFDERIRGLGASDIPSTLRMRNILKCGIGVHHAGLLPAIKEIAEDLFERRLIKVLYCTETFSVGINMPVKAVCFDSWQKYDGVQFRDLRPQEYFQMSGRAGRRGIDVEGYAFTLINMRYFSSDEFPDFESDDMEDLRSRFRLSYNTVLNLVSSYTPENIKRILDGNFAIYQLKKRGRRLTQTLTTKEGMERELAKAACGDQRTLVCPLDYGSLEREAASLKAKLRSIPKKAWRRKKVLQRQLTDAQERLRPIRPRKCDDDRAAECQAAGKLRYTLKEEIKALKEEISQLDPETVFHHHFSQMAEVLTKLDYINPDGTLAPRGVVAAEIHVQELLVTELMFSGLLQELDLPELAALCVGVDYVPRKEEFYARSPFSDYEISKIVDNIAGVEMDTLGQTTVVFNPHASKLAYMWAAGIEFKEVMKRTQLAEGDVVLAFRRSIDLMRQIRAASKQDEALAEKLRDCIERMDRDVVRVNM